MNPNTWWRRYISKPCKPSPPSCYKPFSEQNRVSAAAVDCTGHQQYIDIAVGNNNIIYLSHGGADTPRCSYNAILQQSSSPVSQSAQMGSYRYTILCYTSCPGGGETVRYIIVISARRRGKKSSSRGRSNTYIENDVRFFHFFFSSSILLKVSHILLCSSHFHYWLLPFHFFYTRIRRVCAFNCRFVRVNPVISCSPPPLSCRARRVPYIIFFFLSNFVCMIYFFHFIWHATNPNSSYIRI